MNTPNPRDMPRGMDFLSFLKFNQVFPEWNYNYVKFSYCKDVKFYTYLEKYARSPDALARCFDWCDTDKKDMWAALSLFWNEYLRYDNSITAKVSASPIKDMEVYQDPPNCRGWTIEEKDVLMKDEVLTNWKLDEGVLV